MNYNTNYLLTVAW